MRSWIHFHQDYICMNRKRQKKLDKSPAPWLKPQNIHRGGEQLWVLGLIQNQYWIFIPSPFSPLDTLFFFNDSLRQGSSGGSDMWHAPSVYHPESRERGVMWKRTRQKYVWISWLYTSCSLVLCRPWLNPLSKTRNLHYSQKPQNHVHSHHCLWHKTASTATISPLKSECSRLAYITTVLAVLWILMKVTRWLKACSRNFVVSLLEAGLSTLINWLSRTSCILLYICQPSEPWSTAC